MAEKSLEVKITADVTSLQAKSAVAKAELKDLNATLSATAKEFAAASDEMKATLEPQLEAAAKAALQAKIGLAGLNEELKASLHPEVTGFFGQLSAGVSETTEKIQGVTEKLSNFSALFGTIGELAAVGFAGDWLGEQVMKTAELGESYSQLSEKTGATAQQLGGLRLAAMETGTDFDQVGNGLRSLGTKMQDAITHPSGEAAQAFKAAQISITDSSGQLRPVVDVFSDISAAMNTYADGTAKTALAGDLLGAKFGSALIPVMNQVGQGFDQLQTKAQDLGVTMSASDIAASDEFMEGIKDVDGALVGLRNDIFAGSLPAFTALADEFISASEQGGALNVIAEGLGIALKVVADTAVAVVTAGVEIGDGFQFVGEVLGDVILVADGLAHALDGDFAFARASVKVATADIANSWTDMLQKMNVQETLFTNTDVALWSSPDKLAPALTMNGLSDHQGASNQAAPQLSDEAASAKGGGDRASGERDTQDQMTQIAQDASEARKSIAASEFDAQKSVWSTEVAEGKLTKAQEIEDEIAAQNQMYAADLAEAQKEAALDADFTAAKAKALDDIEVMVAHHNATLAQLNAELVAQQAEDAKTLQQHQEQAAAATSAAWQKAFQPISQAFDSSINGIIQGTQTLQNAELKAAQNITLAFVDAEAKKVLSFVAGEAEILSHAVATELGMTAASAAGNTTRLAQKSAADATGKAADVALGTETINADAMKAAAGAYSAVAGIPFVGPALAPAAGATAYAAVMAFDVLSAAGGTVIAPGLNPLVQLHENEMVLPAYIAQPLQSMIEAGPTNNESSTGDTNVTNHFNLTANGGGGGGVDADSILSTLNAAVRSGSLQKYPAIARMMRR